jgi:hypothetical protein
MCDSYFTKKKKKLCRVRWENIKKQNRSISITNILYHFSQLWFRKIRMQKGNFQAENCRLYWNMYTLDIENTIFYFGLFGVGHLKPPGQYSLSGQLSMLRFKVFFFLFVYISCKDKYDFILFFSWINHSTI